MRFFGPALCLALWFGVPLVAQPAEREGGADPPPTSVVVPRGDHFTVKFWPNRSWYGNTIVGRVDPYRRQPADGVAALADVTLKLVRFERIRGRESLPDMNLQDLQAKLGEEFREVGVRTTQTDGDGDFQFEGLGAGIYSLQIDWSRVPEEVSFLVYSLQYPEKTSEFRSLLVPVVPLTSQTAASDTPR